MLPCCMPCCLILPIPSGPWLVCKPLQHPLLCPTQLPSVRCQHTLAAFHSAAFLKGMCGAVWWMTVKVDIQKW